MRRWTVTHRFDIGYIRQPMPGQRVVIGDGQVVPTLMEVVLPGVDGEPALRMRIEVLNSVPRCTELSLERVEDGREIRTKDLKSVMEWGLDNWVENFIAMTAGKLEDVEDGVAKIRLSSSDKSLNEALRAVRAARKGSRRPMTDERKMRVADVYNQQETHGLEAVELAFNVSRATAARYVRAAREAGLITQDRSGK